MVVGLNRRVDNWTQVLGVFLLAGGVFVLIAALVDSNWLELGRAGFCLCFGWRLWTVGQQRSSTPAPESAKRT